MNTKKPVCFEIEVYAFFNQNSSDQILWEQNVTGHVKVYYMHPLYNIVSQSKQSVYYTYPKTAMNSNESEFYNLCSLYKYLTGFISEIPDSFKQLADDENHSFYVVQCTDDSPLYSVQSLAGHYLQVYYSSLFCTIFRLSLLHVRYFSAGHYWLLLFVYQFFGNHIGGVMVSVLTQMW